MTDNTQSINPEKTALLVMDYQQTILNRITNAEELLSRLAKVIDHARGSGVQIGYVRVAFSDADYAALPDTNKAFKGLATRSNMHDLAPETAIHKTVAPEPGDIIVRKIRVGAFSTTDLDKQLRNRGIDTLILAGISTSGVVLSTLRDAADKDYRIFVLADCCMDQDPQVHDVLMTKVFPRQATIINSTTFLEMDFELQKCVDDGTLDRI
jgi:nicotinamidase-related amidase